MFDEMKVYSSELFECEGRTDSGEGGDMLVGAEEEGVAAWLLPVTVSCWVMRGGRRRGEKQRMEAADRSASISLEGGRLKNMIYQRRYWWGV